MRALVFVFSLGIFLSLEFTLLAVEQAATPGPDFRVSGAVPDTKTGKPPPEIAVPAPSDATRLAAGVAVQPGRARLGEEVTVYVKVRLAPGFHIYGLDDGGNSNNVPTSISVALSQVLESGSAWRGPKPKAQDDGSRILTGDVLFERRFLVRAQARPGRYVVPVKVSLQVCNEAACWPPETIALEAGLEVVDSRP